MGFNIRATGALLGLACGDALGAPAEFKRPAEVRARWSTLTEMTGGGIWAPGEWTDDTGMTLCVAEGLLASPHDPVAATGERFLQWQRTAKDVGSTISAALRAFKGDWARAAQSTPQAQSGKAAGNGSLMRTLPVAIAYPDRDRMLKQGARISAITPWDPQAEICCALYCVWMDRLLHGEPLLSAWHGALEEARPLAEGSALAPDTPGPQPLPTGFWERLWRVEHLTYEQLQPSGYAGYVVECLEAAVWCSLHGDSPEHALIQAVNLAGEADTIAALTGAAVGAAEGIYGIPRRWLEMLHQRERLERTAEELIQVRQHLEVYSGERPPHFEFCQVGERIFAGRNPLTEHDIWTLRQAGVTHFLDLRDAKEWQQPRKGWDALYAIEEQGLSRLHLPLPDQTAPSLILLDRACEYLEATLAEPEARIYVHCRAGQERTGAVLTAWYAKRHNCSFEEALGELQKSRRLLQPLPNQEKAVRAWLS